MEQFDTDLHGAILNAHSVLLLSLVATHPNREQLMAVFARLISKEIEDTEDPRVAAVLQTFEDTIRQTPALDGPP